MAWVEPWASSHSMATEPQPAPMSHNVSPGQGARADRVRARAGRLVIWPSWSNQSSGMPLAQGRSEEHTSELQSLMRISYAVFCLKKKHTKTCVPLTLILAYTNVNP